MNNLSLEIFKAKIGHITGVIRAYTRLILSVTCISAVYRGIDPRIAAAAIIYKIQIALYILLDIFIDL